MNITFLGQGYEPESKNSVGNHLLNLLSQKDFHTFTGISAFASEAGVVGIADHIETAKKNFKRLNLIVGIDEEGTSKEALYEINNLQINSFIFYQEEPPIFHPKVYLFEGNEETKLILGSSNLTARGLFGNVESSLLVEFPNNDEEGKRLLAELKDYYNGLFNFTDPNLFKISEATIQEFIAKGIVPNETVRFRRHGKQPTEGGVIESNTSLKIPKRAIVKIPISFRGKPKTSKPVAKIIRELEILDAFIIEPGSLVWQKKNLPSSDAQQVSGGTKITGVLRLGDAEYKIGEVKIDRNTYFRDEVFGKLKWTSEPRKNNSPLEIAHCKFKILVNGKNLGVHNLKISHDIDRISDQHNIPTTIHWGSEMIAYLKRNNVIGKTLNLHFPKKGVIFSIVIE
jgi:HKD family nuclease